jgi:uncharacterized protein YjiS (DUF1127 family)
MTTTRTITAKSGSLPASWLICRCRAWIDRRAAARTLSRFDDRMLKDIDITRSDIAAAVRGDFGRT